jgi:hypothetical protein
MRELRRQLRSILGPFEGDRNGGPRGHIRVTLGVEENPATTAPAWGKREVSRRLGYMKKPRIGDVNDAGPHETFYSNP